MLIDFAEIRWLVCNLTCQRWRRISLKSDVVCQSYGNVYRGTVFSWTRCRPYTSTKCLCMRVSACVSGASNAKSKAATANGLLLCRDDCRHQHNVLTAPSQRALPKHTFAMHGTLVSKYHSFIHSFQEHKALEVQYIYIYRDRQNHWFLKSYQTQMRCYTPYTIKMRH